MKTHSRLRLGGLQQKIFNLMLIIIIALVSTYVVFSLIQQKNISTVINQASEEQYEIINQAPDESVRQALESYAEISKNAVNSVKTGVKSSSIGLLIITGIIVAGAITAALILSTRTVKPLNYMTSRIRSLSGGDNVFKMEKIYRTGDEVEVLAESFADLSKRVGEYISQITKITAEKERISTELSLAAKIQEDMLPNTFPAFPGRTEFDIFASMTPALTVGGDFYDFFLIDDDHLGLVMADVSGKGVPAALFMMMSKILLQNAAKSGLSPAEVLAKVNSQICANNRDEMFVTVWLGILEISTGILKAANAGHEYPAIKRANGKYELYKDKHGFVIGGMDGIKYTGYEIKLEPGDSLFQYTDGVTEATDEYNEMFGTDRMLEVLNAGEDTGPEETLNKMGESIKDFAGEADQFDDVTMLCMTWYGADGRTGEK